MHTPLSKVLPLILWLIVSLQVGDHVVEINGEQTQGISHTRAIELIQAGGNKVLLLLRPQALLAENSE